VEVEACLAVHLLVMDVRNAFVCFGITDLERLLAEQSDQKLVEMF